MPRGRTRPAPADFTLPLDFACKVEDAANESWRNGEMLTKVTATTRELLTTWFADEWVSARTVNFHEGQRRALLSTIYLHEVLGVRTIKEAYEALLPEGLMQGELLAELGKSRFDNPRYAIKMATGTGKTWVLNALLVWQYLNARNGEPGRYSKNFLVVAPGLIVYERLLEALAGKVDDDGVRDFAQSDMVRFKDLFIPEERQEIVLSYLRAAVHDKADLRRGHVGDGIVAVTNWHALALADEEIEDATLAPGDELDSKRLLESVLPVRPGKSAGNDLSVLDASVARGREIEFLKSLPDLVVFNDEAQYVREEAKWEQALVEIASGHETYVQVDFSATPYQQVGGGKKYFPHIIVDFDLREATRLGLVKLLALDERMELATTDLDYNAVRDGDGKVIDLSDGQRLMLRAGRAKLQLLEEQFTSIRPDKHPKMLIVCEETSVVPHVKRFFLDEGMAEDDILEVHSGRKGEVPAEEWESIRRRLFGIDCFAQPKVIISVLMLREGFDVSNICVIVPLRSAAAPILLEQVVGRGLRLMWREPEYAESRLENLTALLARRSEPPTLIDILSVIEHPRFREFYRELLEGGLAFTDTRGDDVGPTGVLGDFVMVPLREGYEAYDFRWPTIHAEPEETLATFTPDPASVPPFEGFALDQLQRLIPDTERFVGVAVPSGTRFGDYDVQSGVIMSESYNEFLQRLVQRVSTVLGERLVQRRVQADVAYPLLQVHQRVLARFADDYVRSFLFGVPFNPNEPPRSWRVLLVEPVTQHLIRHLSAAVLKYHESRVEGSHDIRWRALSSVPEIPGRESHLLDTAKTIYVRTSYPSNRGGLERDFAEACNDDAGIDAFLKLMQTRHEFVSFKYQAENGNFAPYYPDFLVRVGDITYVVETKSDGDAWSDLEVVHKKLAAVAWCERINAVPADLRDGITFKYTLVSESVFAEFKNRGQRMAELLEFCVVRREAPGTARRLL